jgi:hypothetical protein
MRICNLGDGLGQLAHAVSELDRKWVEAKEHWNDEAGTEFEQTHLAPIPGKMQLLVAAAQVLAATAEKAGRELGDHDNEI